MALSHRLKPFGKPGRFSFDDRLSTATPFDDREVGLCLHQAPLMFTGDHQSLQRDRAGSSGCEMDDGFRCGDQAPAKFVSSGTLCRPDLRHQLHGLTGRSGHTRGEVKAEIAHCRTAPDLPAL